MAKTINEEFLNARGQLCQQIPYERILETRDEAHEKLHQFIIDCKKNFGLTHVHVGDDKDEQTAINKANRDYNGDRTRVLDYVRSMGVVDNPTSVIAMLDALADKNSDVMLKHGVIVASSNNLFEDPKDHTGYRCLNYKLSFPVGSNEGLEQERHIVEFQIVAKQLEALYDTTHPFKREAEDLYSEKEALITAFEERHGRVHDLKELLDAGALSPDKQSILEHHLLCVKALSKEISKNQAACRYHNGTTARDAGYDILLSPEHRSKHEITRTREQRLESQAHDLLYARFDAE